MIDTIENTLIKSIVDKNNASHYFFRIKGGRNWWGCLKRQRVSTETRKGLSKKVKSAYRDPPNET